MPPSLQLITDPAAAKLEPETSLNYAVGAVIDTGPFTLTADYFRIDLDDRIAVTRDFTLTA